ncbi:MULTISPECIES: enoyl-CoA hydratase-related protein [unclassified Herbaspirillum]|uniref:enoyl-CoA hydratase-related protein n=1 Tax=unclassified Herbaspirillum TaxID=2624150 RepID=UPI000E2FC419|nr:MULTISPECIES: enoyl-CoA hydratase-related protein [unclassified Herbaspirillum]RFB73702.1 gamma-carboxygeranoyl-CoA hydratase [Herbaspirillum sp. 3R-3a1]TFI10492.1 gamma-carboxygeranoyl-CoA hydratase [Herbaspirillum sp. 3R11]TFI16397.1 gamma-carboxygeranoyl-CoA hydratase [Herbaspirillum sp. 3R-11]TFI21264.1 gamma-carboxygeranoyl-CoA hydratase [Herbaspirillum sp. 3C11]
MSQAADLTIDARGVATITLNRPEVHNAFDDLLIAHLIDLIKQARDNPQVNVLVLASTGKSFSAGADLGWMRRMADATREDNLKDAHQLAALMESLNNFPCPTVARIQGTVMGGGVGLVSCCDVAIASDNAFFALSEVKLGLAPAVISPYVIAKIGTSQARRYFVTAERFSAIRAAAIDLVHEVVPATELEAKTEQIIATLLANGPQAMRRAKELAQVANPLPATPALRDYTTGVIADLRASEEGKEGLRAFLEKESPAWITKR